MDNLHPAHFLAAASLMILTTTQASFGTTVDFDWATVGNTGNAADFNGFGSVSYEYNISTTEVTNAQYTLFLNKVAATDPFGLYNTQMEDNFGGISRSGTPGNFTYTAQIGRENNPVTFVSWFDSIRFINWLHNGQANGDTETGVYTLLGGTPTPSNADTIVRDTGAKYFLPSADEWYKSAYHDSTSGMAGNYFLFATGSDSVPISDQPGDNPSAVNYRNDDGLANGFNDGFAITGSTDGPGATNSNPFSDVGAYIDAESPYGTFDQNGNVWEWNETSGGNSTRGFGGGSWNSPGVNLQSTIFLFSNNPTSENFNTGFRIASLVPEPASILLISLGAPLLLRRWQL